MNPTTDTTRRADLAKIHLAKKELRMTDEDYAAVISRISKGRTNSAGELDVFERGKVLAHFKRCGWQPKHARKSGSRTAAQLQQIAQRHARRGRCGCFCTNWARCATRANAPWGITPGVC